MQYKNNKKEKSIFAKTIEESKNEISIDWAIRNSKSVVNDIIEAKPELKNNINELKAIKRYNKGFIDRNTLVNDYVDYSSNLLGLFYKTYKAIKIVGNTQYHAANQYYCQVGEIQWLSYKNGPNMCTGGTAIAESTHSGHSLLAAFDDNISNSWSCNTKTTGTETWICYIRTTATPVYCIRTYPVTNYAYLNFKNFRILASNNTTNGIDGTWDTLLINQNTYYVNNWSEHYITNQTLNNSIIAKGGNTVTKITDNGINYAVHTFTSSGSFEVLNGSGEVEYLVVAGGGGGGGGAADSWCAGGGGGGGLLNNKTFINKNIYSIIIGAGGSAGTASSSNNGSTTTQGNNGNNSIFNNIIAIGGGGGGASSGLTGGIGNKTLGKNGGSGGGGGVSYNNNSYILGGISLNNQGNNGGNSSTSGNGYGGGGGGANTIGISNITNGGGGSGKSINMDNLNKIYSEGGGTGVGTVNITNAVSNTGNGGSTPKAPASTLRTSGNGGSGIVIIRYRIP